MDKYIFIFLIFLILIPGVSADGMAFKGLEERWALQPERTQHAAINYEDGYENMLLLVTLETSAYGNDTVWIFPVPARPDDIGIDIVKGYPLFGGKNLDRILGDTAGNAALLSVAYGTFPADLPFLLMGNAGFFTLQKSQEMVQDTPGLIVHERIEKMGMVTELVTARDGALVRDHLEQNGFVLPEEAGAILDEYTGQDYSLVISRKNSTAATPVEAGPDPPVTGVPDSDSIGVFVRFPSDRIYFPLRPTSIYHDRVIPVQLDVTGFVTPHPSTGISGFTETSYYIDEGYWNYYSADALGTFFNHPSAFLPVKYTRIRINAPSESFDDDLFIDPVPPAQVQVKDLLIGYPALWAVPLYVIGSMLASLAAGTVIFGRHPAYRRTLALHGLWNCATMAGFAYGTVRCLKIERATRRQKLGYFVLFYALFTGTFSLIAAAASPAIAHGLANIFTFLLILPVAGFMFGMYIFPRNPVFAIVLFILNAGIYGGLWLAVKKYL